MIGADPQLFCPACAETARDSVETRRFRYDDIGYSPDIRYSPDIGPAPSATQWQFCVMEAPC